MHFLLLRTQEYKINIRNGIKIESIIINFKYYNPEKIRIFLNC